MVLEARETSIYRSDPERLRTRPIELGSCGDTLLALLTRLDTGNRPWIRGESTPDRASLEKVPHLAIIILDNGPSRTVDFGRLPNHKLVGNMTRSFTLG